MIIKVKNHRGHYDVPAGYDSWLNYYWKEKIGVKANECSNLNCKSSKDLVGGHVDYNGHVYIIPICYDCNNKDSNFAFEVKSELLLLFK